jgi:hypothetical protein
MEDFYQGKHIARWRCNECDFDLCLKCMMRYAQATPQSLTHDEIRCGYFIILKDNWEANKMAMVKVLDKEEAADLYNDI